MADHICSPTRVRGKPHDLPRGHRWRCTCRKLWEVTRYDKRTCGCGWARVYEDEVA